MLHWGGALRQATIRIRKLSGLLTGWLTLIGERVTRQSILRSVLRNAALQVNTTRLICGRAAQGGKTIAKRQTALCAL